MTSTSAPRSRTRSRLITAFLSLLAIIGVLVLVVGGYGIWSVQRAFPQTDDTLQVNGLHQQGTVQRDAHGIPVITAETAHDLFLAQGYVHAQDRFWEMDFRRHMTAGRLTELFGESQLGADKFLRSLDWHGIAAQEIANLPQRERAYYEAYADGVNAYLAERQGGALAFEYTVLGFQNRNYEPAPWTPVDSAAWLKAMAWDLRTNLEEETARALLTQQLDAERLADLYPEYPFDKHPIILTEDPDGSGSATADIPARTGMTATDTDATPRAATTIHADTHYLAGLADVLTAVDELMPAVGEGIGSNSWVVAGQHTESGLPLLANDPHLGASLPSVWHQVHLRCATITDDCPYDVAGFSFSGLPGVVIGHNQHIAWGFTNLTTDVADFYVEKIQDDGYWHDGELRPFDTREETFTIAGGDEVTMQVRSTHHGPILSDLEPSFEKVALNPPVGDDDAPPGDFALSLRWTALGVSTTAQSIFTLNRAQNFAEFRQAAYEFEVPGQNLIYADTEGNIGYQAPGKLPIRGAGDGYLPQPGWDSAYDWQGFIPFDELPVSYNPDAGYIITANNAIVTDEYPYFLSRDWDYGHRAARITELLESMIDSGPLTVEMMSQVQLDTQFPGAEPLQEAYAAITIEDDNVREALELLATWDGHNDADSGAAAYANVLWEHVTRAMVQTQEADIRRDDQSRFVEFFIAQLKDPESIWWGDSKEALLTGAAESAYHELVELQGADVQQWNWGELHALWPTHGTFGATGIGVLDALFNRGPYPTGGGAGVVNATGWDMEHSYVTTTVPSMRMVTDLSDWDQSVWQNLTGTSGHAFHPNYVDQADDWAQGNHFPWPYSPEATESAAQTILILEPAG